MSSQFVLVQVKASDSSTERVWGAFPAVQDAMEAVIELQQSFLWWTLHKDSSALALLQIQEWTGTERIGVWDQEVIGSGARRGLGWVHKPIPIPEVVTSSGAGAWKLL